MLRAKPEPVIFGTVGDEILSVVSRLNPYQY